MSLRHWLFGHQLKRAISKRVIPGTMVEILEAPKDSWPIRDPSSGLQIGYTVSSYSTVTKSMPQRWWKTVKEQEIVGPFTLFCECGYIEDAYYDDGRKSLPLWPNG